MWDAKCYERHAVITLFLACEKKYWDFANGRRFSLVLFARSHPRGGDFVLMRAGHIAELLEIERRWKAGER